MKPLRSQNSANFFSQRGRVCATNQGSSSIRKAIFPFQSVGASAKPMAPEMSARRLGTPRPDRNRTHQPRRFAKRRLAAVNEVDRTDDPPANITLSTLISCNLHAKIWACESDRIDTNGPGGTSTLFTRQQSSTNHLPPNFLRLF